MLARARTCLIGVFFAIKAHARVYPRPKTREREGEEMCGRSDAVTRELSTCPEERERGGGSGEDDDDGGKRETFQFFGESEGWYMSDRRVA